jgi:hypothetical protein
MVVRKPGVVQQLPDKVLPGTESTASLIGHINFDMKATGERNAGNPHVAFEVAGAGNGMMEDSKRARNRKRGHKPRVHLNITASVLDPTGPVVECAKKLGQGGSVITETL